AGDESARQYAAPANGTGKRRVDSRGCLSGLLRRGRLSRLFPNAISCAHAQPSRGDCPSGRALRRGTFLGRKLAGDQNRALRRLVRYGRRLAPEPPARHHRAYVVGCVWAGDVPITAPSRAQIQALGLSRQFIELDWPVAAALPAAER